MTVFPLAMPVEAFALLEVGLEKLLLIVLEAFALLQVGLVGRPRIVVEKLLRPPIVFWRLRALPLLQQGGLES